MKRTVTTLFLLLAGAGMAAPALADTILARPASNDGSTLEYRRRSSRDRYREPRYYRDDRRVDGWMSIRGGFYDAEDVSANDWTIGFKVAGRVVPSVTAGIAADLHRRTDASRTVTTEYVDPTGHRVVTSTTGIQAESNLVPLMGSLEFHMPSPGIDPYFGGALGWEFLNVQATDFDSGLEYEANYDGPGYQLFAGIGLPLGPRAKLTGEAYWNGSTVKRTVYDPDLGFDVEERVKVDGAGGRAGLSFAF
jgi:hypothetical protein